LKRVLGYSSIAQFGYLLVALVALGPLGEHAVLFYLTTYSITTVAAFGVITVLSSAGEPRDLDRIEDLRGLFWTRPALAAVMTLALLSLAGIPPVIGFVAKMYVLAAAIHEDLWVLTGTLVVGSVIGLFYYLKIILVMSLKEEPATLVSPRLVSLPGGLAITIATVPLVLFGILPQPLLALLKAVFG
jgi:NADH-quinone oxidoreductase subunit N